MDSRRYPAPAARRPGGIEPFPLTRRLVLDPLFSGLPESIFHADPHAGNLMAQTQKHAPLTLVLLDWSQAGRLSAPRSSHSVFTASPANEPSPDVLTRLLESNRKSSGFRCLRALAIHCTPRSRSCSNWLCMAIQCRSTFSSCANPSLTLDGITRQLDPDFNAWLETLAYAGVFASEAVVRTWSIQFPWLDRPDFYRSGLPTRTLAAHFAGTQFLCRCKTLVDAFRKTVRCSIQLRNHPEPSQRKQRKEVRKKHEC